MKYMHNMNNNIEKYSVMKEDKGSVVLIGAAIIAVIIMLIMSFIPKENEIVTPESQVVEMESEV